MTDPGWDIPGVPREPSPGACAPAPVPAESAAAASPTAASPTAASSPRRSKSGRKPRAGSLSASSGLSAGAFAPLRDLSVPSAARSVSSPRSGSDCDPATASTGAGSAATPIGSAAPRSDSAGPGSSERRTNSASTATARRCTRSTDPRLAGSGDASVSCPDTGSAGGADPGAGSPGMRATDPAQALAFVAAGLEFLAHANPAEWPAGQQADCLRALAVAESQQTAVHARVLQAFSVPGGGLAGDGHRSPRVWLTWQTAATVRAAGWKVSWMHRLTAHPAIAAALTSASISASWAQQVMDWTRALPDDVRDAADGELLAAAASGAGLADLAAIAEDLRREHARPDEDKDDGFNDRRLRLDKTFGGAGRLEGDLSERCTAITEAVLGALSQPTGPEDDRTAGQRQHDALEEAMTRLLAADGLLPQRAGQPVRLELDITLDQLANGGAGSPAGPGSGLRRGHPARHHRPGRPRTTGEVLRPGESRMAAGVAGRDG